MKNELGLSHCEGRGWRGFPHHATPRTATNPFTALERPCHPAQIFFLDQRRLPHPMAST